MKTPILETERLFLRPVSMDDAPVIQKYFNNWNIIKNIGGDVPWPYPENGAASFLMSMLRHIEKGQCYLWALVPKTDPDNVIGLIEYRFYDEKDDNRGFWLAEPFWGRGLMREAVEVTQDFIFFELGKNKIIVKNAKRNSQSRRVKEKTGAAFIREDVADYHGGRIAQEVWEVTRENWTKIRGRSKF